MPMRLMLSFPKMAPLEWISCIAISYREHGILITRSWCAFVSSPLNQEMSARYLASMMHNQEMMGPCDVFSVVAPLAVRCPRPEQGPASNLTISGLFIGAA